VSLVLLVIAVISVVLEVRKVVDRAEDLHQASSSADLSVDWDLPLTVVWRRFGLYIGIILAVYLGIFLIGYPLALCLFIFIFYRLIAKASWTAAVIAGCAGLGFLALASSVLGMDWPQGLLQLPWPLG
jgi:Na+/glutamate symporter